MKRNRVNYTKGDRIHYLGYGNGQGYSKFTIGKVYELTGVHTYDNGSQTLFFLNDEGLPDETADVYCKLVNIIEKKYSTDKKFLTLPTDSQARKDVPVFSGCIKYFPAAIAGVAKISKAGNDKHNPGQELHHDRSKSLDHKDCILRHLMDTEDLIAALERGQIKSAEQILAEVNALAWRALAYSQSLHEKYAGAPLAPGAKLKDTK